MQFLKKSKQSHSKLLAFVEKESSNLCVLFINIPTNLTFKLAQNIYVEEGTWLLSRFQGNKLTLNRAQYKPSVQKFVLKKIFFEVDQARLSC